MDDHTENDTTNDFGLSQFPPDWWRQEAVCRQSAEWFGSHLVPLVVVRAKDGKREPVHATGFLFYHCDRAWWATAGHVIDALNEYSKDPAVRIVSARYLLPGGGDAAGSVPVELPNKYMLSLTKWGVDFGLMWIPQNTERLLIESGVNPIDENAWRGRGLSTPEGHYMAGYPDVAFLGSSTRLDEKRLLTQVKLGSACLPIELTPRLEDEPGDFWNDERAIYGKLLPFSRGVTPPTFRIEGMSGGPLFSFAREPKGLRYHLVGIERGWLSTKRVVRFERIERVLELITPPATASSAGDNGTGAL